MLTGWVHHLAYTVLLWVIMRWVSALLDTNSALTSCCTEQARAVPRFCWCSYHGATDACSRLIDAAALNPVRRLPSFGRTVR